MARHWVRAGLAAGLGLSLWTAFLPTAAAGAASRQTWTPSRAAGAALAPFARDGAAMSLDAGTGSVVLFGGSSAGSSAGGSLGDTWEWDGAVWGTVKGAGPSARSGATMAYEWRPGMGAGQIVLFGGCCAANVRRGAGGSSASLLARGTWIFNGTSWRRAAPPRTPSPRRGAAAAYDAATGRVVLFGGVGPGGAGAPLGDTWLWNGTDWSNATPGRGAPSPAPRRGAAMAYDAATGTVVLFGGLGGRGAGTPLGDTWVWNGRRWRDATPPNPSESPPPRAYASMAYDPASGTVVLFGGAGAGPHGSLAALGDTWVWDGLRWSKAAPAKSPPARWRAGMSTGGPRDQGAPVLFGGEASVPSGAPAAVPLGDTWTWHGVLTYGILVDVTDAAAARTPALAGPLLDSIEAAWAAAQRGDTGTARQDLRRYAGLLKAPAAGGLLRGQGAALTRLAAALAAR